MVPRLLAVIALPVLLVGAMTLAQQAGDAGPDVVTNATVPTPPIAFIAIQPCRLADTRGIGGFTGPFGPPALVALTPRAFPVAGHCGIPNTAQAVSANLTVTEPVGQGNVAIWPEGAPQPSPLVSSINFVAGQTIANAIIAPLGTNGGITLRARVGTHVVIDANGYYAQGVTAHRVVDSTGRTVASWDFGNWAVLTLPDGSLLKLPLEDFTHGFHTTSYTTFYLTPDCSGDAYAQFEVPPLGPFVRVGWIVGGNWVFYQGTYVGAFSTKSYRNWGGDPPVAGGCMPENMAYRELGTYFTHRLDFVPPLHIE